MLLTIHDASLRKVAFIDNDKQATLNYFNDTWTRYLETGSSTFDFTVFKKAIISDVRRKRAYNYLNEKAFVSFQYNGKTYLHTIRKIEENEKTIKCYGINLNLELINEYANPYKAPRAMTFKEYCDAMDLLNFTFLKIGVNEVSTQKISTEWEGTDTKLNRLLSLAKKFGAEIEFDTYLNADSSIKSFVVNVYHENDDTHQGVGRISPTVLTYGKNLKTLTRTVDKTNIYNMVRPTGRTDNGDIVTISGLSAWSVNNAKGEREFYQAGEGLYAPLSMQMYPSAFTSGTMGDQWIRKDMTVESSNPEVIRSAAYRELKKNCYPAVTYEAEGFADLEIGDTVKVYDDGFSPVLLLEMRVSEQTISFTNPKNNKTTFSNAKALENLLSQGIQERLDRMIEDAKPYIIKLATDNGTSFKNGQGQSIVTPTLMKGNKVINSGWRWVLDGNVTTGTTYTVRGADVADTATLTVSAYVGNDEVAVDEISFVNVLDGSDGANGLPGKPGADGKTSYWHTAYANSADGKVDFHLTDNAGRRYFGHYNDYTLADSTDHTKYKWVDMAAPAEKIVKEQAVLKTDVKVTDEGIVTSASKTVNGQTIASMIAQRAEWVEIIAQLLKIKADMIVDGAITADKLNVTKLSSIISNLGEITGGSLTLSNHYPKKTFTQVVESNPPTYIQVKIPEHDTIMEIKEQYIRFKGTPSYMPIDATTYSVPNTVINQRGVFWTSSDYKSGLPEGSSSIEYMPVDGRGKTGIKVSSSKNIVLSSLNADIVLKASNYTDWTVSTVNRNVRWKVQGNLVIVDYDVTFSSSGNQQIVTVPTTYVPKALMLTVKAWKDDNTKDRNAQLNAEGDLHILATDANQRYCGQIVWAY